MWIILYSSSFCPLSCSSFCCFKKILTNPFGYENGWTFRTGIAPRPFLISLVCFPSQMTEISHRMFFYFVVRRSICSMFWLTRWRHVKAIIESKLRSNLIRLVYNLESEMEIPFRIQFRFIQWQSYFFCSLSFLYLINSIGQISSSREATEQFSSRLLSISFSFSLPFFSSLHSNNEIELITMSNFLCEKWKKPPFLPLFHCRFVLFPQ